MINAQSHLECDGCDEENEVRWYCMTCPCNLCDKCKQARIHRDHTVHEWTDLEAVDARQNRLLSREQQERTTLEFISTTDFEQNGQEPQQFSNESKSLPPLKLTAQRIPRDDFVKEIVGFSSPRVTFRNGSDRNSRKLKRVQSAVVRHLPSQDRSRNSQPITSKSTQKRNLVQPPQNLPYGFALQSDKPQREDRPSSLIVPSNQNDSSFHQDDPIYHSWRSQGHYTFISNSMSKHNVLSNQQGKPKDQSESSNQDDQQFKTWRHHKDSELSKTRNASPSQQQRPLKFPPINQNHSY